MYKSIVTTYYYRWWRRPVARYVLIGFFALLAILLSMVTIAGIVVLITQYDASSIIPVIFFAAITWVFWYETYFHTKRSKIIAKLLQMDEEILDNLITTYLSAAQRSKSRWVWDIDMDIDEDIKLEIAQVARHVWNILSANGSTKISGRA